MICGVLTDATRPTEAEDRHLVLGAEVQSRTLIVLGVAFAVGILPSLLVGRLILVHVKGSALVDGLLFDAAFSFSMLWAYRKKLRSGMSLARTEYNRARNRRSLGKVCIGLDPVERPDSVTVWYGAVPVRQKPSEVVEL